MPDFIDVSIPTTQQQLADDATDNLGASFAAQGIVGWTANEASLEMILLGVSAAMAADVASQSAQVPAAIFRNMGTKLFGVPYRLGASATVASTWTLTDTAGHTIPGGTQVTVSGVGFYVQGDVTVAPGASTGTVTLVAGDLGTAFNGLGGPVELVDAVDWVSSIAIIGSTSGGVDPEDDVPYENRLASALALQAPRPITAADFAGMVLSDAASDIVPSGVVVGRATALDLWDSSSHTFTANTTSGSATLASVSSFTGVTSGSVLTGVGIPANTSVLSVNTGASTLVMSNTATATGTGVTITANGSSGDARTVSVFVTDPDGQALSSAAMTALQTWLEGLREANFVVYVVAPRYVPIYVTAEVHVLPSYDSASVVSAVEDAITSYLSPKTWGNTNPPTASTTNWLNSQDGFNIVRYNKLLGVIEAVPGVDFVPLGSAGLKLGLSASPTGLTDLTMAGAAPLPTSDTSTPTVIVTAV